MKPASTTSSLNGVDAGASVPPKDGDPRPLVSVIVPAFNEAAVIVDHLQQLCAYLETLEKKYRWELLVVNDGSRDETGELAEAFAAARQNVRVLHHRTNFGLGQAFRFAFGQCRGDYIVTLDSDLSYTPEHVERLLTKLRETNAKIVVASPYMAGGKISNVPWLRKVMSIGANRFLSLASRGHVSTLTGMVRAYDGRFLRGLHLRSTGMEVNPEIIHKAVMLRAKVTEVPAHLNWRVGKAEGMPRRSSMKMFRQILSVLLSGFLFRPVLFFILPGLLMLLFAVYVNGWMLSHFLEQYRQLTDFAWFLDRASVAVSLAYQQYPHTFLVGGLAALLSIQLISLGILSLQSKAYFEEIFHLGSSVYRLLREEELKKP